MQTGRNLQFNKGLDSHSYVTTQRKQQLLDLRVKTALRVGLMFGLRVK